MDASWHICAMTHSYPNPYMCHDLFIPKPIYVPWLIHAQTFHIYGCVMTYMCHDSFIPKPMYVPCLIPKPIYAPWLIHTQTLHIYGCVMTHIKTSHSTLMNETWHTLSECADSVYMCEEYGDTTYMCMRFKETLDIIHSIPTSHFTNCLNARIEYICVRYTATLPICVWGLKRHYLYVYKV